MLMLRKSTSLLAPLAGLIAIVGAGFSVWYFDVADLNESGPTISTEVTDKVTYGEISVTTTDTLTLVLDQGGIANASDVTKGISVVGADDAPISSIVAEYDAGAHYQTIVDGGLNPTITTTITVSEGLRDYVTVVGTGFGAGDAAGEFVRTSTFSAQVTDLTIDCSTTTEVNALFSYVTGMKPTTSEAYDTMVTAVTGGTVTIAYSVSFGEII